MGRVAAGAVECHPPQEFGLEFNSRAALYPVAPNQQRSVNRKQWCRFVRAAAKSKSLVNFFAWRLIAKWLFSGISCLCVILFTWPSLIKLPLFMVMMTGRGENHRA